MWFFQRSGHQFSGFSLFQPNCDFEQPSHDFAIFLGFVCHFFDVGAIHKPDKTHSCCSGGSEPHFQHAFSENPSKNYIKVEVVFRTGLSQFSTNLRHRSLFTLFWPKLLWKHQKGHPNDPIFINFLIQSLQKRWLNDPGSSRMTRSWKRLLQ